MAYNEELAKTIKLLIAALTTSKVVEKKMFGGTAFLINGNMSCGVLGDEMIVRVDPQRYDALMKKPNTRLFDFSGKPMKGWIVVTGKGCKSSRVLSWWVKHGVVSAASLPKKNTG